MNSLGVYFGPRGIYIAETKGKKLVNSAQIPLLSFAASQDDKVPEEVKIVALFKEELRKSKIEAKEANLVLSGLDLIMRTFEIPALPANELGQAINFELKKYIPFKIEELVSDYQVQFDKASNRNSVLFIGIKKETLEKYLSIFSQLNIKIASLEYAAFSIFKLINLCQSPVKDVAAVVDADTGLNDEANFTVAENSFPLFGRDIKLSPFLEAESSQPEAGILVEKLNTEIRISLDYYSRKFIHKKVNRLLLIGSKDACEGVEAFLKEINLPFNYVDPSGVIGKPAAADLGLLKAFSGTIVQAKPTVKINLLAVWSRQRQQKEPAFNPEDIKAALAGLRPERKFLVIAGLIICAGIAAGVLRKIPLEQEIKQIISSRPKSASINARSSLGDLQQLEKKAEQDFSDLSNLVKNQLYFTPGLSAIPKLLPPGTWLERLNLSNVNKERKFVLQGNIYLKDSQREAEALEELLLALKNDPALGKLFTDLQINSMDSADINGKPGTRFSISGSGRQKGER